MYRLVASVGVDAHKSTINPDDEILTVLGGKASCRRKFVINVHLLDEEGNTIHEEFAIIASVAYAHDRSPIVQDENLFLAEPPLLTTFNGVEYPSQDRPTRLVGGKATFKLAISLLSSKYDNRLFCICFTPQSTSPTPEFSGSTSSCLPTPCYSKPIRSISRKRSSSVAPPLPLSHHILPQPDATMFCPPPSKVKSPDSAASEEVEKFFRVSSAASSSEDDDKTNCQNGGDAASDSGSLRYIASNSYKQEAQLLRPDAIHGDPFYSIHEGYSTRKDPFFGIEGVHCEGYLNRRDPLMQLEATQYESFPSTCIHAVDMGHHEGFVRACIHMDAIQHHHDHYDSFSNQKEALHVAENGELQHRDSCSVKKEPVVLIDNHHSNGVMMSRKDPVEHAGGCYLDSSGRLNKVGMHINGRFSPNPVASRSESTSPISGILTSDGSIEQTDAFSRPSSIPAAASTERPLSAPHPISQLSSPFRPYNPNAGPTRVSPCEFQRGNARSPSYMNGLRRESPEGILLLNKPASDQLIQTTLASSSSKKTFDAVLQRFLTEASHHATGGSPSNIEEEEQSLLALEVTLQNAIRELEKKKEELRNKRQRLIEDDEAHIHNIVFQSPSWVETLSMSRKYNY
ncbi:hypothetical protein GOP47_0027370 [Adiantum capillus-veneris]|nr:hypothetical protein GOP47_0027370 [Adiantum capillus-veneris]